MPKTKSENKLTGNETIPELMRAIETLLPNEDIDKPVEPMTTEDILDALWLLSNEINELSVLKNHSHQTKVVDVVVPGE
jgi:hypothetical protein